ncbi:hypothetical protein [Romboutsia maritimum]|uniref:hypothetical protein n=1 Tax=Romboutsia maritimum TaxID=2020948 RepID=UPI0011C04E1E|nr:hypothetical protein [Romboutsia maritimum]
MHSKKNQKWYKVEGDEVLLLVNEQLQNNKNQVVNNVDWINSKANLFIETIENSKEFYEKNKELKVRLFIKADEGNLYNEYKVSHWYMTDEAIELDLL